MASKSTVTPMAEVTSPNSCDSCGSCGSFLTVVVSLSLILNFVAVYLLLGFSLPFGNSGQGNSDKVRQALLELEYDKVGGKQNYDILHKYSLQQIEQNIDSIKGAVNGGGAPTPKQQPSTESADTPKELSQDEVKAIVSTAALEGNKDASIVVVEYSDMECPFCIRQYHSTKLFPSLLAQYGDKIALAFKNNRGVNHPGTEAKAIAALCARKVGGDAMYQKFYKGIMDKSTNESGVMAVSELPNIAKSIGIDTTKWQSCVEKKDTMGQFDTETREAQKYGLGGTPGTIILNVKTGKYATVEGAYPYEKFTANVDALMK